MKKIKKLKLLKNQKYQSGFTLIELLASAIVIVTVGAIVVSIVVSSLRGTTKTNAISVTRQNGTHAISQVSKMLRFARSVDAIGTSPASACITNNPLPAPQTGIATANSVTYTTLDGDVRTIACLPLDPDDTESPMTIASMSGTLPDDPITEISGSLLDTAVVEIPDGMCEITCNQSTSSDAMIVGITFSLETVKPEGTLFSEFSAAADPIEFTTSVILRNLGR